MYSSYNAADMGTRLMLIKLAQGVSAVIAKHREENPNVHTIYTVY